MSGENARLKRKPINPTSLTPEEIVGMDLMPLLELHYKSAMKAESQEELDKAMTRAGINSTDRKIAAEAYEKLREHGIHPGGMDRHNNILWRYALRGDLQNYVEALPLPTKLEIKEMSEHIGRMIHGK